MVHLDKLLKKLRLRQKVETEASRSMFPKKFTQASYTNLRSASFIKKIKVFFYEKDINKRI